jgi:hypothetical protein
MCFVFYRLYPFSPAYCRSSVTAAFKEKAPHCQNRGAMHVGHACVTWCPVVHSSMNACCPSCIHADKRPWHAVLAYIAHVSPPFDLFFLPGWFSLVLYPLPSCPVSCRLQACRFQAGFFASSTGLFHFLVLFLLFHCLGSCPLKTCLLFCYLSRLVSLLPPVISFSLNSIPGGY